MHSCICVEKPGKGLVIFGQAKRGAVTACGLGTEGPVFWMQREESRGEERGVRNGFTVDVLLPRRQFMNYCWLELNVRSSQNQIHLLPTLCS